MALFGTIGEFFESKENWSQYAERFKQFLAANDIEDNKKKSIFLATIGPAAYRTLANVDTYKLFVILASHRIRYLHHRLHFVRNHIQLPRHILHVIVHHIGITSCRQI